MLKENIRRIVVTGVHKEDMVMYCGYILSKLRYKVLICDRTENRELERCIRKPDKPMDMVRYKEIDFAFSDLVSLDEGYDYIFYVQDYGEFARQQTHKYVFLCDGCKDHLDGLIDEISKITWGQKVQAEDCMIVYRDLYVAYGMEYVEKYVKDSIKGMSIHAINHDCMDEACYQRMQFRPFSHLADISSEMESAIKVMLQHCTGLEEKAIKRGIKLAKRGRAY